MRMFKKLRRDRLVTQVVSNGESLNLQYSLRAAAWPEDCVYLDAYITVLERKRDKLLARIKETA